MRYLFSVIMLAAVLAGCGGDEGTLSNTTTNRSTNAATNGTTNGDTDGGTDGGMDGSTFMPDPFETDARSNCDLYCQDYRENCRAQFDVDYPDDGCYDACPGFPDGMDGDWSGDSLSCRRYHTDAASIDPATHCPLAGRSPVEACID